MGQDKKGGERERGCFSLARGEGAEEKEGGRDGSCHRRSRACASVLPALIKLHMEITSIMPGLWHFIRLWAATAARWL